MAGYTDISNSEYAAKNTAWQNQMNGVQNHSVIGLAASQIGPQLFTFTIGKILNGSKKDDSIETNSVNAKEKEELKQELNEKLKALNITAPNQINETVNTACNEHDTKISEAQTTVNNLQSECSSINRQIGEQQTLLKGLNDETDRGGARRELIKGEIEDLKTKLEAKQKELADAQAKLQETIKTEDAKLNEIRTNANEALVALNLLSKMSTKEEKFDASETKETLAKFNQYRNNFSSATTLENKKKYAKKLKKLYENNPNDATIKKAYEAILKTKVEAALK